MIRYVLVIAAALAVLVLAQRRGAKEAREHGAHKVEVTSENKR
jgi:hypothetical protein